MAEVRAVRIAFLSMTALALSACGKQEAPAAAPAPATSAAVAAPAAAPAAAPTPAPTTVVVGNLANSRAVLDGWLRAMNQHDEAAAAAFLAGDAEVFDALLANVYRGREAARSNVIAMYLRAVPDGQWSLRGEPVVAADGFSYEWSLAGTNQGNWTSYLRGRGQQINFKGATFVRLREGRIAYQATYFDTNALGAQAGW